jgi:tetratricopeptide (TPR) repeat protein
MTAAEEYQAACACDGDGRETEAIGHYERALELGLSGADRHGAYLGLGSSYRCVGRYGDAVSRLRRGLEEFPASHALRVFLAMALHNLGEHAEAMQLLLIELAETSGDPEIRSYQRAIRFYSDQLDRVWT